MIENPVVVVSAVRTPIGKCGGLLKDIPPYRLAGHVIEETVKRLNPPGRQDQIHFDKMYMGQVYVAGQGQSPKRQALLDAAPSLNYVPTIGVDAVCASSLEALMLAADELTSPYRTSRFILVAGMESMSSTPFILRAPRSPKLFGNLSLGNWLQAQHATEETEQKDPEHTAAKMKTLALYDTLIEDGLRDAFSGGLMGAYAEICALQYTLTRAELDAFALSSHTKAKRAHDEGFFKEEIVPLKLRSQTVERDEGVRETTIERLSTLPIAFGGFHTAGTSSQMSDGAAALVITREQYAKKANLPILARIVSFGTFAQRPERYTTAPIGAVQNALRLGNLRIDEINLIECNEAFATVPLALMREYNIPKEKMNVHGGAIALGHPLGATGARITTTLIYALRRYGKRYGLATACNGGGEARAVIFENPEYQR